MITVRRAARPRPFPSACGIGSLPTEIAKINDGTAIGRQRLGVVRGVGRSYMSLRREFANLHSVSVTGDYYLLYPVNYDIQEGLRNSRQNRNESKYPT